MNGHGGTGSKERQFAYFHHVSKESQVDIQQTDLEAVTVHWETPKLPKVILASSSSLREQDAANHLSAQEKHDEDRSPSASIDEQIRSNLMIFTANKKEAKEKLWHTQSEISAKDRIMTPTASLNFAATLTAKKRKEVKSVSVISDQNKDMVPEYKGKKQPETDYVTPAASHQKKAEKGEATTALSQENLDSKHVTSPFSERKRIGETDTTDEHWMAPTPHALKVSTKIKSLPTAVGPSVSASGVQGVTHPIPEATPKKRLKASDFKSEPHWEFEDQYLLDSSVPQSNCPNSLRVKAVKSDWFKDIFLPNITLFMDRSHFSDSEWKRLEHFAPPFGFMELNYSLVKEVITMLPPKPYHQILLAHNSSQTSRCISCAVVGNGGILNNSRMGQEIDSHDYVFRVSGAITKGYERDVGMRTSFYGFTAFSLMASLAVLRNHGFTKIPLGKEIKYLHFLEGERDYEWLKALLLNKEVRKGFLDYYGPRPRDPFKNTFSLDNYFVIHPDFLRYLKNRFLRSKSLDKPYWRIYRPTTGAFLLLTALHLCDQVSAYGYITEGYQKYSDHYYDKEWKRLIFYINHDFDLERRIWKQLHDANVMKLYQRS
ncbi:alpha-N-acetylgalactosaminide alpha-2,6-sialyltransferase 1 isoform X2 [Hemicordylus capensis]|uniref:alpha-N-acetylgalactosaminide alpha-2,6-sialyltransferase 1 isoform X2 n=1 Tax=Hemicordylus capensis TaxID=884348 RepID=UPI0023033FB4|nr:alpha-N-acetylgalactosaminide alpha-2,6-sialyltransferase 1 isoform X2 [Hemicordylus capensis]